MKAGKIAILLLVAALVAAFFHFRLGRFLTLESLQANRAALSGIYTQRPLATMLVFVCIYILQTVLALPGAAILSLAAGAVFGVLRGSVAVIIGATSGATLAFLLTRHLFRDAVRRRFGPRLEALNAELERSGLNYLLFLRLVPLFPFFLINLGAGLTSMSVGTFLLGTAIGIIPGCLVFCNAGASLAGVTSLRGIVSPRVLLAFTLLGLLALVPVIARRLRSRGAGSSVGP